MTFNAMYDKAHKQRRLPHEATEVLAEIRARLSKMLKLTPYEQRERIDAEFNNVTQGRSTHAEFRAKWESILDDMSDAGMALAQPSAAEDLRRIYLRKLTPDLRKAVMDKPSGWPLDGEGHPSRVPRTWEEVAEAVELELMTRTDIRTHSERYSAVGEGNPTGGAKQTKAEKKADRLARLYQVGAAPPPSRPDSINAVTQP